MNNRGFRRGGSAAPPPSLTRALLAALLLLPLCVLALRALFERLARNRYRTALRRLAPSAAGFVELVRWLALLLLGAVLGWVLARALGGIGLDPRGGVLDTYVQRNTLVVGFAMGFAVIPIIYTIAEDALNAVPEHLRAAGADRA